MISYNYRIVFMVVGGMFVSFDLLSFVVMICFRNHFRVKHSNTTSLSQKSIPSNLRFISELFLEVMAAEGAEALNVPVIVDPADAEAKAGVPVKAGGAPPALDPPPPKAPPGVQAPAVVAAAASGSRPVKMASDEKIRSWTFLGQVLVHVGLLNDLSPEAAQEPVVSRFLIALGAEAGSGLIEIGENPLDELNEAIANWAIPGGEGVAATPPTLIQKGRARLLFRIVRTAADLQSTPVPSGSPPVGGTPFVAPVVAASSRISLKEVVSQISDASCEKMSPQSVLEAYARYETQYGKGKAPPYDEEPTEAQLESLQHLLLAGDVPYVDFALWAPHGHRLIKKTKLCGQVFNNRGELHTVELSGPATFEMWLASFNILQFSNMHCSC